MPRVWRPHFAGHRVLQAVGRAWSVHGQRVGQSVPRLRIDLDYVEKSHSVLEARKRILRTMTRLLNKTLCGFALSNNLEIRLHGFQ